MASHFQNKALQLLLTGALSLTTDTIKAVLVQETYTPDKDHSFAASITAHELSVTGYTGGFGGAGRKALANAAVAQDDVNDRARFSADDPTWAALAAGQSIAWCVLVKEVTSDADSPIIAVIDVRNAGAAVPTNGSDVTVDLDNTAALALTA